MCSASAILIMTFVPLIQAAFTEGPTGKPSMRRTLPILLLALGMCPGQAKAATVSLRIVDEMDPAEIEETTSVFINGELAATFSLDAGHRSLERAVAVPAAQRYEYALCGRITVRGADGRPQMHVLDDGAILDAVDGMRFEALAAADFTTFYLSEMRDGFSAPPRDLHRTHVCAVPTS